MPILLWLMRRRCPSKRSFFDGLGGTDKVVDASHQLCTLYILPSHDPLLHTTVTVAPHAEDLLHVQAPYFFLSRRADVHSASTNEAPQGMSIITMLMSDFRAILHDGQEEGHTMALVRTMMDFGAFTAQGDIDQAIQTVEDVQTSSVWLHIAKMCVKMHRLDALPACFARLKNARAAMNFQKALLEPQLEARIGLVAIELGSSFFF